MSKLLYQNQARTISSLAKRYPVVAVFGPRGNSKTHLVRSLFPTKDYVDLGNDTICALAKKSFKTFLLAFPNGAIINEANRIPGLVDAVRYYVDKWGYEPGRYILISCANFDISALEDRGIKVNLIGPSIEELDKAAILTENPFHCIQSGALPKVLDGTKTYAQILDSCFAKDFSRHINSSNTEHFLSFLKACAASSGLPLSMNSLAKAIGVSAPTVKTWLQVLRTYHVAWQVTSEDNDNPKLFFTDSGLLCHLLGIDTKEQLILSPYKDQIVRTFALMELIKGRSQKALDSNIATSDSCDFTAHWKLVYNIFIDPHVEVTIQTLKEAKYLSLKDSGNRTVVLYLGDVTYTQDGIDCIGYRDWTKFASGVDYFS